MLLFLQAKFLKVGLLSQKISAFLILIDNWLLFKNIILTFLSAVVCFFFFTSTGWLSIILIFSNLVISSSKFFWVNYSFFPRSPLRWKAWLDLKKIFPLLVIYSENILWELGTVIIAKVNKTQTLLSKVYSELWDIDVKQWLWQDRVISSMTEIYTQTI